MKIFLFSPQAPPTYSTKLVLISTVWNASRHRLTASPSNLRSATDLTAIGAQQMAPRDGMEFITLNLTLDIDGNSMVTR